MQHGRIFVHMQWNTWFEFDVGPLLFFFFLFISQCMLNTHLRAFSHYKIVYIILTQKNYFFAEIMYRENGLLPPPHGNNAHTCRCLLHWSFIVRPIAKGVWHCFYGYTLCIAANLKAFMLFGQFVWFSGQWQC